MKRHAIICDLDGTLCDITERRKFLEGDKPDWKNFNLPENILRDIPNAWCVNILSGVDTDFVDIVFVSGRMSSVGVREATVQWLYDKCAFNPRHSGYKLYMRQDKDYRKDTEIKKEIYEKYIKPDYDVLYVLDDRKCVVDMWREQGLVCLQCAEGDF